MALISSFGDHLLFLLLAEGSSILGENLLFDYYAPVTFPQQISKISLMWRVPGHQQEF